MPRPALLRSQTTLPDAAAPLPPATRPAPPAQELFLTHLLPDRKLRVLEAQPLAALPPGKDGERRLLMWAVEDAVKSRYAQYVGLLEKCRCGGGGA